MIQIRKTSIVLEDNDLIELERIIIDDDEDEALKFLKKSVYKKIVHSQQGRLKSHLDGISNPPKDSIAMPRKYNYRQRRIIWRKPRE
jgi:hypothetical protein